MLTPRFHPYTELSSLARFHSFIYLFDLIFKTSIPFLSLTSGQGKGQHRHGEGLTALDDVLSGSDIYRNLSHESDLLILVINKIAKKA